MVCGAAAGCGAGACGRGALTAATSDVSAESSRRGREGRERGVDAGRKISGAGTDCGGATGVGSIAGALGGADGIACGAKLFAGMGAAGARGGDRWHAVADVAGELDDFRRLVRRRDAFGGASLADQASEPGGQRYAGAKRYAISAASRALVERRSSLANRAAGAVIALTP